MAKATRVYPAGIRVSRQAPARQDRLQQPVGGHMPAFIPSGVLQGKSALEAFERSLERYRQGLEPDFQGVAELLNMTATDQRDLYLMTNPSNSFNTALRSADAVWCTDWDAARAEQVQFMFDHSYGLVPSESGDHAGHLAGISLVSPDAWRFFEGDAREVKNQLVGCQPF